MNFVSKQNSHWNDRVIKDIEQFALVLVDNKDHILNVKGDHWNEDPMEPITKEGLKKFKTQFDAIENPCCRWLWAKTDHGTIFYEANDTDIPEDATTELDRFLIVDIDKYGNKSISENPIKDTFDLWEKFYDLSSEVARLESHWRIYDKSRLPEIYEMKQGFVATKLQKTWESYDIVSKEIEFNAKMDKMICDEIQQKKKYEGDECWEFVTTGEAFEFFLERFD